MRRRSRRLAPVDDAGGHGDGAGGVHDRRCRDAGDGADGDGDVRRTWRWCRTPTWCWAATGADRTLVITPAANQAGTATITVTVSDGTASTPQTFTVTVTAVNDAPTLAPLANVTTPEDTATAPISLTIGDVETPATALTVTATSVERRAGAGRQPRAGRHGRRADGDGDAGGESDGHGDDHGDGERRHGEHAADVHGDGDGGQRCPTLAPIAERRRRRKIRRRRRSASRLAMSRRRRRR